MYSVPSMESITKIPSSVRIVEKSSFLSISLPTISMKPVYYTLCVESVESCRAQFSPIFSFPAWYGRAKQTKGGMISVLGPRIAALRKEKGLSQAELAQQLKISPSAVGMYEQGRREPSAQLLVAMAQVFDISTDYLLTGQAHSSSEADALQRMLLQRVTSADRRLEGRTDRPFSRQELAVLFAAMLME